MFSNTGIQPEVGYHVLGVYWTLGNSFCCLLPSNLQQLPRMHGYWEN